MSFWDKSPKADPYAGSSERLERGERVFSGEPEGFALDEATLKDLKVFSRGGLYERLDKTRTHFGSKRLAALLRRPFLDPAEIRRRQEAVRAIASDEALRSALQRGFLRLRDKAGPGFAGYFKTLDGLDLATFVIGLACWLWPAGYLRGGWAVVMQYFGLYFMILGNLVPRVTGLRENLLRFKAVFRFCRDAAGPLSRSSSEALREIGGVFDSLSDKAHPLGLRKAAGSFARMLPMAAAGALEIFFMWGSKTLWHPLRLLRRSRERVAHLLGALGELDAYLALAELLASGAPWTMPQVDDGKTARLRIEGGHHPLVLALRGAESVPNGADLEAGKGFHVVTGTNMGGKSTYLGMAALLPLLGQIGAPVPALAMTWTPAEILTSVDVSDDLQAGKSLYDAETDRLLAIVRGARSSTRLLAIMDEILQGTNPEERTAAEGAVVRFLAETPNLFIVATHNLSIADIARETTAVSNFHVAGETDKGSSRFRVLPGPATDRNGILTLERKGFPESIVRGARERLASKTGDWRGPPQE
jgi:DNA mismatch repair ATPase MutS